MFTSRYGKLNQENIAKRYQNQPRFVKDMTNTCWCVFFGSQIQLPFTCKMCMLSCFTG